MGFLEFRDPDAPMSLDEEFKLWDKSPSGDEMNCPRCSSPMKSWEKKCKVCGYVEGEEDESGDLSDEDLDSDEDSDLPEIEI